MSLQKEKTNESFDTFTPSRSPVFVEPKLEQLKLFSSFLI